ncbi:cobyrinate a,c-diamide synthase [Massilia antarctica]|uniref:cobyrinate a,c-diamide synthase n=1 Tax=Massilia antarctica TaxID=2765360 RepID=UPI0006BB5D1D|nr:cobyrinate a,c-diamide synthase [Massilia sp. H27-R4]MCY0916410.1 cobyrinate a,c-diamide synthase [Massilia sp. H27-R4]CUI07224.1 Cobyrinic acid A,C-diamide synthase [Janthinobacterium sp. CG23_2]CUU31010.1 Cobyrinic acid A,C-diamide synthase [Janthinobacterium sp. CG23_2]
MADHADVRVLLVAAVSSGQGKTTVTAALARALVQRGQRVRVFKCGPDFIDPMLLERASGAQVGSLDLWMVGREQCRSQLAAAALEADVILIEGVMGLYDGTPSSADLAREFGLPVMAVIDASAMAQTAGALVHGLRDYGPVEMAGVIANRVASKGHGAMVAASMRDIPLIAILPRQTKTLPERHLGLVLPSEVQDVDGLLDLLADQLEFDDAAWMQLRSTRIDLTARVEAPAPLLAGRTIAIARDAAFAFLYPANLDTLRALGASLAFFSPLADDAVPAQADAVYLPGGYPELHGETLAGAARWRASIRAAHAAGMPIVAECGGMMALADSLADQAGTVWPMAGLLEGSVTMQGRIAGLGSQGLEMPQGLLRGHTFHYSRLETGITPAAHTVKHPSGASGEALYRAGSLTASYFHAYFPSCPAAVAALFSRSQA